MIISETQNYLNDVVVPMYLYISREHRNIVEHLLTAQIDCHRAVST